MSDTTSQRNHQEQVPGGANAHITNDRNLTPRTLEEAGITLHPDGHYTLPAVEVQYRGGHTQTLLIDVGSMMVQPTVITTTSLATVSDLLRNRGNGTSNNSERGNQDLFDSAGQNFFPPSHTQASFADEPVSSDQHTDNSAREAPTTNNSTTDSENRRPIRGLDYPAFDVSSNGIYNDDSQPASRILGRLFERALGTRASSIPPTQTTNTPSRNTPEVSTEEADTTTSSSTLHTVSPSTMNPVHQTPSESRNIILTVNYVYGSNSDNNSGSLLLYVPNIDDNNEENVGVLVRLTTEIALRTIATALKKSAGVSKEIFDQLEVKRVEELNESDSECPICYDKYVNKDECSTMKRKRVDGEEEPKNGYIKRAKNNSGESTPLEDSSKDEPKEEGSKSSLKHYPVAMKCGHIFGASCLQEWLKTNNSCPLCRDKLPNKLETENNGARYITITLPNLARIIGISRPLIQNFNNRQMTFTLSDDQDSVPNDIVIDTRSPFPNTSNTAPTLDIPERSPQIGETNSTNSAGGNNGNTPNNGQSLLNFIRDVISSFAPRNTSGNGRVTQHTPRPFRSVSRTSPQFGGIFPPLGVESRRTANGVETRELSSLDNSSTVSMAERVREATRPGDSNEEGTNFQHEHASGVRPSNDNSSTDTNTGTNP